MGLLRLAACDVSLIHHVHRHHLVKGGSCAAGVAQAAASAREPAAAHGGADPPLRDLVESYAQDAGMEFLPKARLHEGLQVRADALGQSCM